MIDPDHVASWASATLLVALTIFAIALDTAAVIALYHWMLPQ